MSMDTNSKTSAYNNSAYGQNLSAKQAIYNNSKYGQAQAAIDAANNTDTTSKSYVLPDGKVLVRPGSSNRIDFKSLFGSIGSTDDETSSDADTLALISSMESSSDSIMSAYANISKQRLGLS